MNTDSIQELFRHWGARIFTPDKEIRNRYLAFRELLQADSRALELVAELESHLYGQDPADPARICWLTAELELQVRTMSRNLVRMNPGSYRHLASHLRDLCQNLQPYLPKTALADTTEQPCLLPLTAAADHPWLSGGKAANLARAKDLGLPVPDGFVITTRALAEFYRANDLPQFLEACFQKIRLSQNNELVKVTAEIQEAVINSHIPPELAEQIEEAAVRLAAGGHLLAVRSSARAEDGLLSFAGQYSSELDIAPGAIVAAYKRVVAGKYCSRAISYRIGHGLSDQDTAMAALVIPMVKSRASGVIYTIDPGCPAVTQQSIGIYAVPGLGASLVNGSRTPSRYHLSRTPPHQPLAGCGSGDPLLLGAETRQQLAAIAMMLEEHFSCAQDVEWAVDQQEQPVVLQCRPLNQETEAPPLAAPVPAAVTPLLSGLSCASTGTACGTVYRAENGAAFRQAPLGAVVVTGSLQPAYSFFLDRVAAVLAVEGSRASHFASMAREKGVPVMVGAGVYQLHPGDLVTVDTNAGCVYSGEIAELLTTFSGKDHLADRLRKTYAPLAQRTVHLNLTTPDTPEFSVSGCRSLHDVIRYCHEQGVAEMFSLVGRAGRGMGRARRLQTSLPLVMYLLDLGGGLTSVDPAGEVVTVESIASIPMAACLTGIGDERISWDHSQLHIDWQEFDRVSAGIFKRDDRLLASYAIISRDYLHLNIRFGYHFSVLDSLCGDIAGNNYINFRFKGGGAAMAGRVQRLRFIREVLQSFGFQVSCQGDLLDASASREGLLATRHKLQRLGLLLAATRQLDLRLSSEEDALQQAREFVTFCGETDE